MESDNGSTAKYFFLQGLTNSPQVQLLLFLPILAMYLLTMLGNSIIVNIIHLDLNLHTPMYFLMGHLAFIDMCYVTVITPKMLANLLLNSQLISYHILLASLNFFSSFILGSLRVSYWLLWPMTVMQPSVILCIIRTSYPEDPAFVSLLIAELCLAHGLGGTLAILFFPFLLVMHCYVCIVKTIISIPSTTGRHKTVVCMFYGTILLLYMRPASLSQDHNKAFAVIFTLITPFLNPFIYALRNTEIRGSFKKTALICVLCNKHHSDQHDFLSQTTRNK